MPPRANPLKLNNLQLRTLALAQVLAREPAVTTRNGETGEVTLHRLPQPHGDHVHIGPFVVSSREASGFGNPSVWVALERKGLARGYSPIGVTLTAAAIDYDTGLADRFLQESDH
jgi:hypothetical protein